MENKIFKLLLTEGENERPIIKRTLTVEPGFDGQALTKIINEAYFNEIDRQLNVIKAQTPSCKS